MHIRSIYCRLSAQIVLVLVRLQMSHKTFCSHCEKAYLRKLTVCEKIKFQRLTVRHLPNMRLAAVIKPFSHRVICLTGGLHRHPQRMRTAVFKVESCMQNEASDFLFQ